MWILHAKTWTYCISYGRIILRTDGRKTLYIFFTCKRTSIVHNNYDFRKQKWNNDGGRSSELWNPMSLQLLDAASTQEFTLIPLIITTILNNYEYFPLCPFSRRVLFFNTALLYLIDCETMEMCVNDASRWDCMRHTWTCEVERRNKE